MRLDMEDSRHTEAILKLFRGVWEQGQRNIGIVLQAYLFRTEQDIDLAIDLGWRVRLCKGAYAEPASVAYAQKADTDANYLKLARRLLDAGNYPAFATHDDRMVNAIKSWQPAPESFEFQMLYGIRSELQKRLVAEGVPRPRLRSLRYRLVRLFCAQTG